MELDRMLCVTLESLMMRNKINNSFTIIHKLIETYFISPPKKQTKNKQSKNENFIEFIPIKSIHIEESVRNLAFK